MLKLLTANKFSPAHLHHHPIGKMHTVAKTVANNVTFLNLMIGYTIIHELLIIEDLLRSLLGSLPKYL